MYIVVDRKFVLLMFISLITNYIKLTETGKNLPKSIVRKKSTFSSSLTVSAINNNMDSNSKTQRQNSSSPENYQQASYDVSDYQTESLSKR